MFGQGIGIEAVVFKEATTPVNGVRVEYHVDGNRVQFHMWGSPDFPEGVEDSFARGLKSFSKNNVVIDFVPEVDSWYVEVNGLAVSPTDALVESIVKKIAWAVNENG